MDSLRGQTAIVTGGGRGLGRAFALGLASAGARVAVAARTPDQLVETAAGSEGRILPVEVDVTDREAVQKMVDTVERELGPVDLLVNNAGSGPPWGPAWEADPDEWWRTIEVNLKGPMLCSRAVLPGMIARGRGRIVNVASGAGTFSIPYMSAYVTSKCALIRLTEVLGDELRGKGVSVFAIQPGTVRTAMAEQVLGSEDGRRWLPWFNQIFEQGHDDSTEPGTSLVLYLASGAADGLSGRFFIAPGDPAAVVARGDEVRQQQLHVLRVGYLPDEPAR